MKRIGALRRAIRGEVERLRRVERFVRLICGGGVALVAGLWIVALSPGWSTPWLLGVAVALLGLGGLGAGIHGELDPPWR